MGRIILPNGTANTKDGAQRFVNWGHPSSRELRFGYLPISNPYEPDLVTGRPGALLSDGGSMTFSTCYDPRLRGLCVQSNRCCAVYASHPTYELLGDITIWAFIKYYAGFGYTGIVCHDWRATNQWALYGYNSSGDRLGFARTGGAVVDATTTMSGWSSPSWHSVAVTGFAASPYAIQFYTDGVPRGTASIAPSGGAVGENIEVGDSASAGSAGVGVVLAYVWNRVLPPEEIAMLERDPLGMVSGARLDYFPDFVPAVAPGAFKPYWIPQTRHVIGSGVI